MNDNKWISAEDELPYFPKRGSSKNVWATDGFEIFIASVFDDDDGWLWANCYGNVFGKGEIDDDYKITHWQPLVIPELPVRYSEDKT